MVKLLEMKAINKQFPGVNALQDVNFDLFAGEVHALLGENGAGKSTLMKILNGIYKPNSGDIFLEGKKAEINHVNDAKAKGISIIHQELVLVPEMTIYENIFLGREPMNGFKIDKRAMIERSQELLDQFELDLQATQKISELTIAQQQMIEIIKAISVRAKIIAMDEPTSSLSDKEVEFLYQTIRNLKKSGVGIIYISHRMKEIFDISDRVTVLRDGQYIGTVVTKDVSRKQLISMMVGRELDNYYSRTFTHHEEVIMKVKNLTKKNIFEGISFDVKKGEILGFSGLVGAGRSEIMKCIFGIDSYHVGEIIIDGVKVEIKNPNDAINHRIVYVPESRKEEGLFLIQPVQYNMSIEILKEFMRTFKVDNSYEVDKCNEYVDYLRIKTPNLDEIINNLSGGNQQKVLIARWLMTKPKLLILDEPTKGIDVGAKSEIYSIMNHLTEKGVSIIMVSSDLPEVVNMSDRVAVIAQGRLQKILERDEISQEKIMYYATGGKNE